MVLPPGHKQQRELGSRAQTSQPTPGPTWPPRARAPRATPRGKVAISGCPGLSRPSDDSALRASQLLPKSLALEGKTRYRKEQQAAVPLNNRNRNTASTNAFQARLHGVHTSFSPYGNLTGKFQMKKTKTRGTKGLGAMTKVTALLSGQEV